MPEPEKEKHVIMVHRVARRWIMQMASPEYRLRVLYGTCEIKNLPSLLKSFRDGRVAMEGLTPIRDLGIKEDFDAVEIWSRNREALMKLQSWFEKRDYETTGIW